MRINFKKFLLRAATSPSDSGNGASDAAQPSSNSPGFDDSNIEELARESTTAKSSQGDKISHSTEVFKSNGIIKITTKNSAGGESNHEIQESVFNAIAADAGGRSGNALASTQGIGFGKAFQKNGVQDKKTKTALIAAVIGHADDKFNDQGRASFDSGEQNAVKNNANKLIHSVLKRFEGKSDLTDEEIIHAAAEEFGVDREVIEGSSIIHSIRDKFQGSAFQKPAPAPTSSTTVQPKLVPQTPAPAPQAIKPTTRTVAPLPRKVVESSTRPPIQQSTGGSTSTSLPAPVSSQSTTPSISASHPTQTQSSSSTTHNTPSNPHPTSTHSTPPPASTSTPQSLPNASKIKEIVDPTTALIDTLPEELAGNITAITDHALKVATAGQAGSVAAAVTSALLAQNLKASSLDAEILAHAVASIAPRINNAIELNVVSLKKRRDNGEQLTQDELRVLTQDLEARVAAEQIAAEQIASATAANIAEEATTTELNTEKAVNLAIGSANVANIAGQQATQSGTNALNENTQNQQPLNLNSFAGGINQNLQKPEQDPVEADLARLKQQMQASSQLPDSGTVGGNTNVAGRPGNQSESSEPQSHYNDEGNLVSGGKALDEKAQDTQNLADAQQEIGAKDPDPMKVSPEQQAGNEAEARQELANHTRENAYNNNVDPETLKDKPEPEGVKFDPNFAKNYPQYRKQAIKESKDPSQEPQGEVSELRYVPIGGVNDKADGRQRQINLPGPGGRIGGLRMNDLNDQDIQSLTDQASNLDDQSNLDLGDAALAKPEEALTKIADSEKNMSAASNARQLAKAKLKAEARKKLIKALVKAAMPWVGGALLAALFFGCFIALTTVLMCAIAKFPPSEAAKAILPKEFVTGCGGDNDAGNASCPLGYTGYRKNADGTWSVASGNNSISGSTSNVTAGVEGIPTLPYKTNCARLNAFLRAIIFKESVLTPNPLVPGPEGVFYWRFPSTPFAKQTPQPHPDISESGPDGSSNAAGAFQFLSDSYYSRISEISELMNPLSQACKDLVKAASKASSTTEQVRKAGTECVDFSPANQTRAAFQYLNILNVKEVLCDGDGSDNSVKKAIQLTNQTWASLPGGPQAARGYSADDFVSVYRKLLKEEAGSENASNTNKIPNTFATVTNTFQQFFRGVSVEAAETPADQEIRDRVAGYFDRGEFYQADPSTSDRNGIKNGNYDLNIVKLLDNLYRSGFAVVTGPFSWGRSYGDHQDPSKAIDIWGLGNLSEIKGSPIKGLKMGGSSETLAGGEPDEPANNGNIMDKRIRRHVDIPVDSVAAEMYYKAAQIAKQSGVVRYTLANPAFLDKYPGIVDEVNYAHKHHLHVSVYPSSQSTYKYSDGVSAPTTSGTSAGSPQICCPPGVTPGTIANTSSNNAITGTLTDAKDSGNEFSQLSQKHKDFMKWVAEQRGYTGPFGDSGGPDVSAKAAADKLMTKARADGLNLVVAGETGKYGYRGYNAQTAIFLGKIASNLQYQDSMGTPDQVPQEVKDAYLNRAKLSAPVGYSEHHTGKGMDFIIEGMTDADLEPSVYNKTAANWLAANAPKEGFRLSYPQGSTKGAGYEPWHWFYDGQKTSYTYPNVKPQASFTLDKIFKGISAEAATTQEGTASFYGGPTDTYWQGRPTASGEIFDENKLTAASNTLPLGTYAKVTNKANGKSVVVKVNDTGGFTELGRIMDLSYAAAQAIDMVNSGIANITVEVVDASQANKTSSGTSTTSPAGGCIVAGTSSVSANNSTTKSGGLPSNGKGTLNSGTYDAVFLNKLADGILPIFSSERDCYRVVAGSGSVLEQLDPDMIFKGLVPSGLVDRAYQFHDFMQQSPGGTPNYVRYGYEYSNDTAKLQRGSLVVLSAAINGDSGDMNVYIGRAEMTKLGRTGDSWMGRPIDNEALASNILGIYTKIQK